MKRQTRENALNLAGLFLLWSGFLAWFIAVPRLTGAEGYSWLRWGALLLTFPISLTVQQYLAGVFHEAAHGNLIQGNRKWNDRLGNWLASYVFLFSLDSYRRDHFKHHAQKVFMVEADAETAMYANPREQMLKELLKDALFISAFQLFFVRNFGKRPDRIADVSDSARNGKMHRPLPIFFHFALLWGGLILFGSPEFVLVFFLSMTSLYPMSTRFRTWAQHGDFYGAEGLLRSEIARNTFSPVYERIFVGNRMYMYHFEHHEQPHLSFRDCERRAYERQRSGIAIGGEPDMRNYAPSYFAFVRGFLKRAEKT